LQFRKLTEECGAALLPLKLIAAIHDE